MTAKDRKQQDQPSGHGAGSLWGQSAAKRGCAVELCHGAQLCHGLGLGWSLQILPYSLLQARHPLPKCQPPDRTLSLLAQASLASAR